MPVAEARVSVAVSTAVFGVRPDPHGEGTTIVEVTRG